MEMRPENTKGLIPDWIFAFLGSLQCLVQQTLHGICGHNTNLTALCYDYSSSVLDMESPNGYNRINF